MSSTLGLTDVIMSPSEAQGPPMVPSMSPTVPPTVHGVWTTKENTVWTVMWLLIMVVFIALPLLTSKRRRKLCMRGIRERRWISDDEVDEELTSADRQLARQRQRQQQRQFQTNRTQEDGIRQQYLSFLMENYTMVLKTSDIREGVDKNDDSMGTLNETTMSTDEEEEELESDVENQCDAIIISSDIGSQDTIATDDDQATDIESPPANRENRCDSEDSGDLLACEFDKDQTVCVPISGQAANSACTKRRLVSNGCAICLCHFEADEKLTWSSNPDCCHVFHNDCIINWYLAVARKTQKRRKKANPNMTAEEALDLICEFPINCPCCRQPFSADKSLSCEKCEDTDTSTDNDSGEETATSTDNDSGDDASTEN